MAALRKQIVLLQDDIRQRAGEEERLLRVNSQLKQRVEDAMETNNRNVEAAESELQVFFVCVCCAARALQCKSGGGVQRSIPVLACSRSMLPTFARY